MSFDQLLASLGLGNLMADQSFIAQMSMTSLTAVLFLASLVLCLLAFRAAGAARRAKTDAAAALKTVHETALEVRQMTAEAERVVLSAQEHSAQYSEPTAIDDEDAIELSAEDEIEAADSETKAPSKILSGFLRRR